MTLPKNSLNSKGGFSLVELIIAVVIVGILASIAIPAYRNYITTAKAKAAQSVLEQIPMLLETERAENGKFPGAATATYTYSETASGTKTDTITPILPGFTPRPASQPANEGIEFVFTLTITNPGTAGESATFSATGVRDSANVTWPPSGTLSYQ